LPFLCFGVEAESAAFFAFLACGSLAFSTAGLGAAALRLAVALAGASAFAAFPALDHRAALCPWSGSVVDDSDEQTVRHTNTSLHGNTPK
jgi:hypothetical protein